MTSILGTFTLLLGSVMATSSGALAPLEAGEDEPAPAREVASSSTEPPSPQPAEGWDTEPAASGGEEHSQPAPASAPRLDPAPPSPAAPAQTAPPRDLGEEPPNGLATMIAGPILIAVGIPLSLAGNAAWRRACGPDTSDRECARGTTLSVLSHTATGLAFAGGITLTGIGAGRRGNADAWFHASEGRTMQRRTGFVVGGAILLPGSLVALGLVRLFFWLPTPKCEVYECVVRYQTTSTLAVGGLALTSGLGAGLMMYGLGFNKGLRRYGSATIVPAVGPRFAGLSLTGSF
jgi:hypothetical protein